MMNTPWLDFLSARGAMTAGAAIAHFGDPAAERQTAAQGTIIADLSHLGLLEIGGEDAVTFLQGQLTNDVKQLNGGNSHYSGYCTAKGRLLAIFLAFAHHGHVHLQLNGTLKEAILKRLKMYVLRSKVAIEDVSDTIIRMGIAGPDAAAALQQVFGSQPQEPCALVNLETASITRLPGVTPRFEIFTTPQHAEAIWNQLQPHCVAVGKECWDWLEIQAGIPDITPATQEAFVPQMVNLDVLGGINFKKGCYTGQEIVARTHYLGKVKRRTHLMHLESAEAPQPGDEVFGTDSTESVGMVVSAAAAPKSGYDVLVEIRLESLEAGPAHWKSPEGPTLEARVLPYGF